MIKPILKRSLWVLLSLSLLAVLLLVFVLHTQVGSRWLVQIIDSSNDNLSINKVEGTLGSKLQLSGVQYSDQAISLELEQVVTDIKNYSLWNLNFELDQLYLKDTKVKLTATKAPPEEKTPPFEGLTLPLSLTIHQVQLDKFGFYQNDTALELERIAFFIEAIKQTVAIQGFELDAKHYQLNTELKLQLDKNLNFRASPNWRFQQADLKASGQGTIEGSLKAVTLEQAIELSQTENLKASTNLNASLDLTQTAIGLNVKLEDLLVSYYQEPHQYQLEQGNLQLAGTLDDYTTEFNAQLITPVPASETAKLKVKGSGNSQTLQLASISLLSPTTDLQSSASLNWQDGFSLTTQGKLAQKDFSKWLPDISGHLKGNYNLALISGEQLAIEITDTQLTGKLSQQDLELDLNLKSLGEKLQIQKAIAAFGDNQISATGNFSKAKLAGELELEANKLADIMPELAGSLSGKIKLSGSLEQPNIDANLAGNQLDIFGNKLAQLNTKILGNPYQKIDINSQAKQVSLADNNIGDLEINLQGNLKQHAGAIELSGPIVDTHLDFSGQYSKQNQSWSGTISEHQLLDKQLKSRWTLQQPLSLSFGKTLQVSLSCWLEQDSSSKLCLELKQGQTDPASSSIVKVSTEQLDLSLFRALLPKALTLKGYLNGDLVLENIANNPNFHSNLSLSQGHISVQDGEKIVYQSPIRLAEVSADKEAQLNRLRLALELEDASKLNLDMSLDNALNLDGQLEAELVATDFLATLSPEISSSQGAAKLNGRIQGPWDNPKLNLRFKHDGAIVARQLGRPLSNTEMSVESYTLDRPALESPAQESPAPKSQEPGSYKISLVTNSDNNQLRSEGLFKLAATDEETWNYQGSINADQFAFINTDELKLVISPHFEIMLTPKSADITGELVIDEGAFYLKDIPEGAVQASNDVVLVDTPPSDANQFQVKFKVNTKIKDSFYLEALGLKSKLKGAIELDNHNARKQLMAFGRLSLTDGTYSIYGQQLTIERGVLIFDGSLDNPQVDVVATRLSLDETVTAGVNIGGTPNYLQSSLFSTPSLSELEILSYLISGRGLGDGEGVDSQQMLQAALLFGLKRTSPFFSELQSSLGIDVLTIKEGATSEDSAIEAGKNLSDDLYLGYNQGIFNRTGFWLVRYKISKALKLESTYGEQQSVDLIYTIRKP